MLRYEMNLRRDWPEIGPLLKNGGSFVLNFLYNRYNNKKGSILLPLVVF